MKIPIFYRTMDVVGIDVTFGFEYSTAYEHLTIDYSTTARLPEAKWVSMEVSDTNKLSPAYLEFAKVLQEVVPIIILRGTVNFVR